MASAHRRAVALPDSPHVARSSAACASARDVVSFVPRSDALSIPEQIPRSRGARADRRRAEGPRRPAASRARDARGAQGVAEAPGSTKRKNDRSALAAIDKARNELVTDVRGMMQQLDHSREKLNRSRTERESNAAQRELEELRKLVRDREEDIGKLTRRRRRRPRQQIEATRGRAQEARRTSSGAARVTSTRSSREVERQRAAKARSRGRSREARSRAQLYRRYETLRTKKRGPRSRRRPTARAQACHMSLPPQLFHRLRREPMLEQCPSCHRLIYFVPPSSLGTDASSERG